MCKAVTTPGPYALINRRKMCPGIDGLEGSNHGHDVIKTATAIDYLEKRGRDEAVAFLKSVTKGPGGPSYRGSTGAGKNRSAFGTIVNGILSSM